VVPVDKRRYLNTMLSFGQDIRVRRAVRLHFLSRAAVTRASLRRGEGHANFAWNNEQRSNSFHSPNMGAVDLYMNCQVSSSRW
jgi:hypothetical protein